MSETVDVDNLIDCESVRTACRELAVEIHETGNLREGTVAQIITNAMRLAGDEKTSYITSVLFGCEKVTGKHIRQWAGEKKRRQ